MIITKKAIAFASAIAMLASINAGFITTSAYDAADKGEKISLEYDAASSTATEKYINIYYAGASIGDFAFTFVLNTNEATGATYTNASSWLGAAMVNTGNLSSGQFSVVGGTTDADLHELDDNKIGTVKITIPETVTDLEVTLTADSSYTDENFDAATYDQGAMTPAKAYEEVADPTEPPTQAPTATPTAAPTATPTAAPTATPTAAPTATPTAAPTLAPVADHDDGFAFAAKIDEIKDAAQLMLTVKATKGGVTKEGSKNIKGDIATISGAGDLQLGVIIANIPGDVTIDSVSIKPIY